MLSINGVFSVRNLFVCVLFPSQLWMKGTLLCSKHTWVWHDKTPAAGNSVALSSTICVFWNKSHSDACYLYLQGQSTYSRQIKQVEDDIQQLLKKINELTGSCWNQRHCSRKYVLALVFLLNCSVGALRGNMIVLIQFVRHQGVRHRLSPSRPLGPGCW